MIVKNNSYLYDMDKILKLYTYVDGGTNDTPFPSAESQIEIGSFRYDAKRMGGAPTIAASVYYPSCLDGEWTDNVYASFNNEKYFLKQIPTSSYSNEDARYKHDVELVSERVILDDVYFFDAVKGEENKANSPLTNSATFSFFGNISEFANKLNSSLEYSGLRKVVNGEVKGWTVKVDATVIVKEEKFISFDNTFFSNAIQESYNSFEVPYYFKGKEIHFGLSDNEVEDVLSYGVENALLSITKTNANHKIVNRVTATGSSENIPYYYPNNSPKGEVGAESSNAELAVTIIDSELYSNRIKTNQPIVRTSVDYDNLFISYLGSHIYSGQSFSSSMGAGGISKEFDITFDAKDVGELSVTFDSNITKYLLNNVEIKDASFEVGYYITLLTPPKENHPFGQKVFNSPMLNTVEGVLVPITEAIDGYTLKIKVYYAPTGKYSGKGGNITFRTSFNFGSESGWSYEGKPISLNEVGLKVEGDSKVGDTITQKIIKYVKTSPKLLPSVYRETEGEERFYNALNDIYPFEHYDGYELKTAEYIKDGFVHNDNYKNELGEYIIFNNPYLEGRPKEHIITIEDIKPTIKDTVNASGLRIDMFSEFAYDDDDNDETYIDEEGKTYFKHPYFYGKLRIMDFNLFDHAIENQPMTISFTSGDCGDCNFEIGVTEEYPQKNPVQVTGEGELIYKDGRVWCGLEGVEGQEVDEYQPRQQDTSKYEVWIALKKEEETYGILMPKAEIYDEDGETIKIVGLRPKACTVNEDNSANNDGDTFVITGINLPQSYITDAEQRLEKEIIKYLQDNNDEKFKFSIKFSRIFFEENPRILDKLNENSLLKVLYNGHTYDLYVASFSYSMGEGDVLPEISVELDETLQITQNAIQKAVGQVKSEIGRAIGGIDIIGVSAPYFLSKEEDDEAQGVINFTKGIKFGEGGKVEVFDNNSAKLTIEYLEVTKKVSFTSLEIQEAVHAGGQILITPASINCGEVEEREDSYRCYFQTKGLDGSNEIFNQFAIGDQAICQTFNALGSKYYWRLVTGVGDDYIDLSKTICDDDSGVPSAGDKIIQLGNQEDTDRQNAIVIAAYGDGSPYIIQYKGINSFEISDDKIVTKLSSVENIFKGTVHIEDGSDGLENIKGLPEVIQKQFEEVEVGGQNLLRNSGFTGDYLSAQLADDVVLEATDQMFNPPLVHWNDTENPAIGATVQDSEASQSGKEVVLVNGSLSQTLYQKVIANETYMFSFKAKGTSFTYSIGGVTKKVDLTNDWAEYVEKIEATSKGSIFSITNANCILCDLQLERGTVATSWANSYLDNQSDRAYYQAGVYVHQALREGSTTIGGGLVLTNHIKVGNYVDKEMVKETGGMQGTWSSDDDPFIWGGGTNAQAIDAIAKYKNNPTYQPTEEELANMAKFVVTHGGRSILNDIILRGVVYAKEGKIGNLQIEQNGLTIDTELEGELHINEKGVYINDQKLIGDYLSSVKLGECGYGVLEAIIDSNNDVCLRTYDGKPAAILLYASNDAHAMYIAQGMVAGLRTQTRVVTEDTDLEDGDYNILVNSSSGQIDLILPFIAIDGQEFIIETLGANVTIISNNDGIFSHYDNNSSLVYSYSVTERGVFRLKYYAQASKWTFCWISRHV